MRTHESHTAAYFAASFAASDLCSAAQAHQRGELPALARLALSAIEVAVDMPAAFLDSDEIREMAAAAFEATLNLRGALDLVFSRVDAPEAVLTILHGIQTVAPVATMHQERPTVAARVPAFA